MRIFSAVLAFFVITQSSVWAEAPDKVTSLGKEAARIRKLSYRPIKSRVISQKQASAYVLRLLDKELKGEEIDIREAFLKQLRLMPQGQSSRSLYRKLYASQVRGLYNPEKKEYVVVKTGSGGGSSAGLEAMAQAMGLDMGDMFTVHELGHAIQDQHFDLVKLTKKLSPHFDRSLAAQSLIEGDASLLMLHHTLAKMGMKPSDVGGMGLGNDMGMEGLGDPNMAAAPTYFRESLSMPYNQGMTFATALHKRGGWAAVDRAFRRLPTTSEQIFHPQKYMRREKAKKVRTKGLKKTMGGYKLLGSDSGGEFTVRILETEIDGQPGAASAGWGGDRYWVYKKSKSNFVVWRTTWDSARDAKEFFDLSKRALSKMGKKSGNDRWLKNKRVYSATKRGMDVDLLLGVPTNLELKLEKR